MLNIPFVKETGGELVVCYSKAVPIFRRYQGDYNQKWQSNRRRQQWNHENSNDNSNNNNSNSNIASLFSENSNNQVSIILPSPRPREYCPYFLIYTILQL